MIAPPANTHGELLIGSNNFAGIFEEIRIWNRSLSEDEAYKMEASPSKSGLAAHYRLDEGEEQFLFDQTGTNDAIIKGNKEYTWVDSPNERLNRFTLFIDGAKQYPKNLAKKAFDINKFGFQFSIGGVEDNKYKVKQGFKGVLEEIRLWNTPRSEEEISDNAFGRLKGERNKLIVNYTFDERPNDNIGSEVKTLYDQGPHAIDLDDMTGEKNDIKRVYSDAPIADEIPVVRSAVGEIETEYHDTISATPAVVEYGDIQHGIDGSMYGILKKCYAYIKDEAVHLVTGFKIGNLKTEWYCQAQFDPQIMGYIEGAPPVPGENFPIPADDPSMIDKYAYTLDNSVEFVQAEEVSYNYATSKATGMQPLPPQKIKREVL